VVQKNEDGQNTQQNNVMVKFRYSIDVLKLQNIKYVTDQNLDGKKVMLIKGCYFIDLPNKTKPTSKKKEFCLMKIRNVAAIGLTTKLLKSVETFS
jgi:hypothetical protein